MRNEVLENLNNISENDSKELLELMSCDVDVKDYLVDGYNLIMQKWQKENPMFDIPSGVISISINGETQFINVGKNHYDENTIFDIASMTKLYTEFILFDVLDDYKLKLDTKIGDLVDHYEDIKDLTLLDLISFGNTYKTKEDMRTCSNKEDAIKALRTSYILSEKKGEYLYTDIPIMILTDIIETYTGLSYKELFDKYIKNKYNLNDTYLDIDNIERYVTINKNMVNDPKANIMGGYYGHGGVKATSRDFIKFLNIVFSSKYKDLFTQKSNMLNSDGTICDKKAVIGNLNLSKSNDDSLASRFLPSTGFAIQGSVRCHGETAIFTINHKQYVVSMSIFLDLYTQLDNILKYEKETKKILTKEYEVDGKGKLITADVRPLLSYKGAYKELTNLVGVCRAVELYDYLKKEIRNNYSR